MSTDEQRYTWNDTKNEWLKRECGFGFEDIVLAIEENGVIDDVTHPNPKYAHQNMLYVNLNDYIAAVLCVKDGQEKFLN